MLRIALLLLSALCLPSWAGEGRLQVYVCQAGQIAAVAHDASTLDDKFSLLASGNAYWVDGRIDQPTSWAMFESAGIWKFARVQDLFALVRTKTASGVLSAIGAKESGRNGRPWPWSINWRGKSLFFDSKNEAVDKAKQIISSGDKLFDVGLMQVNWHFNGRRFSSLEDAFEPLINLRVADEILQEHLKATGNMLEAIGRYHSKTDSKKGSYIADVLDQMDRLAKSTPQAAFPNRC